jgi:hypothetical protein
MKMVAWARLVSAFILAVNALAVNSVAAAAAEKVTLKLALEPGLAWTFDSNSVSIYSETVIQNGESKPPTITTRTHTAGRTQVLAVKDGKPTSLRVSYADDCSQTTESLNQRQNHPWFGAGKTITITQRDDGTVTDDFTGDADAASHQGLHTALNMGGVSQLLPAAPVGVGDQWQAPFGPDETETMKLVALDDVDGRQTARVEVAISATTKAGAMTSTQKGQETFRFDVRTGLTCSKEYNCLTSRSGDLTTTGPDGTASTKHVEGTGKIESTYTLRFMPGGATPTAAEANAGPVATGADIPMSPSAAPFAGKFSCPTLKVELSASADAYSGTITLGDRAFPATASVRDNALKGTFQAGDKSYPFSATLDGETLKLDSASTVYVLKRE